MIVEINKQSEIWKWRVKFLVSLPFGALILTTLYRSGLNKCGPAGGGWAGRLVPQLEE